MEVDNASIKSLCGLQDIYTDFDGWMCRYRAYFSPRGSHHPKNYILTENHNEYKNKDISLTLERLIVGGFITKMNNNNNNNNTIIQDYNNFLKFIQNGDDYLTFINGGKNYTRSKLLYCFIIGLYLHIIPT